VQSNDAGGVVPLGRISGSNEGEGVGSITGGNIAIRTSIGWSGEVVGDCAIGVDSSAPGPRATFSADGTPVVAASGCGGGETEFGNAISGGEAPSLNFIG